MYIKSIKDSAISHVSCHVTVLVKKKQRFKRLETVLRKNIKRKRFFSFNVKYLQPFTFGMIVHFCLKKIARKKVDVIS